MVNSVVAATTSPTGKQTPPLRPWGTPAVVAYGIHRHTYNTVTGPRGWSHLTSYTHRNWRLQITSATTNWWSYFIILASFYKSRDISHYLKSLLGRILLLGRTWHPNVDLRPQSSNMCNQIIRCLQPSKSTNTAVTISSYIWQVVKSHTMPTYVNGQLELPTACIKINAYKHFVMPQ